MQASTATELEPGILAELDPINSLPEDRQRELLQQARVVRYERNETVFRQGDRDNLTCYLLSGSIELLCDRQVIKTVFGGTEAANHRLSQLQPRQMTARALSTSHVLLLDRTRLDHLLTLYQQSDETDMSVNDITQADDDDWMTRLLQSELFSYLPAANIQRLFSILEHVPVNAGDTVIRQGEPGDFYYILAAGRCSVQRTNSTGATVQLAELVSGDAFGEEALLTGSRRNASIIMLTDGVVMRLSSDDFMELVHQPMLNPVDIQQAQALLDGGARWLDVRPVDAAPAPAFMTADNSQPLPINLLRVQARKLDRNTTFICCCDTGRQSMTAAFLLGQMGFDIYYLEGGLGVRTGPVEPAPEVDSPPSQSATSAADEALIEADVRAAAMKAELERMSLRLEQAQRQKAQAEEARKSAEADVEQRLADERAQLDQQAVRAEQMLREAEQLRQQAISEKQQAEAEAERQHHLQQERLAEVERLARERLQQEQERLQHLYEERSQELTESKTQQQLLEQSLREEAEHLRQQLAHARTEQERIEEALQYRLELAEQEARDKHLSMQEIETRRDEIEAGFARQQQEVEQELESLQQRFTDEAERRREADERFQAEQEEIRKQRDEALALSRQQELEQRQREQELRSRFREKLIAERRKMESAFADNARALATAREEKELAERARQAALREAEQIVDEFRQQQEVQTARQREALRAERQRLEQEAERILQTAEVADKARRDAESELEQARREILSLRDERREGMAAEQELVAAEARLASADKRLQLVTRVQQEAESARRDNVIELKQQSESESALQQQLQAELEEWLEQDSLRAELDAEHRLQQEADMNRIRESARRARDAARAREQQLVADLAVFLEQE